MKYIHFEVPMGTWTTVRRVFVQFSECITHSDMAKAVLTMDNMAKAIPVSAGFVDHQGNTYGKSTSMGLRSRPTDAVMMKLPQMYGIGEMSSPSVY